MTDPLTPDEFIDVRWEPESWPGEAPDLDRDAQDYTDDETDRVNAREAWQIDGDRTAAWAVRRWLRASREAAAVKALAQQLRDEADEYERFGLARPNADLAFFEGKLRYYYEAATAERGPKESKTLALPGAKASSTVGSVQVEVSDAEAVVGWLEDHGLTDLIAYGDPSPKLVPLRQKFDGKVDPTEPGSWPAVVSPDDPDASGESATLVPGETIPGVKIKRNEPTFKITPA